ncbi:MAG: DoxX family protein [Halioglobus sp.]|nr:DoxX family protein [Halioglobus sp.]
MSALKNIGLGIVFFWFMGGGIAHFTNTDFFLSIMPPWIGFHREIVYVSGVLEILGALGILFSQWRQWAGNGLLLLVVCVTPANIHMWLNPDLFPDVPEAFLSLRLVVQLALLLLIWWCTRSPVKHQY